MTAPPAPAAPPGERPSAFRHELYPYEGGSAFLAGALSFIDDAVTGGETVLIAVGADKREMLRGELSERGTEERVSFVDIDSLGRNPGRLIPAWQDWIARTVDDGLPVRGISESPWQGASSGERGELRYHEWLLNLAFDRSPAWWLLCPYDTGAVEPDTLESARQCHPFRLADGAHGANPEFVDRPFAFPELTAACDPDEALRYGAGGLAAVRDRVTTCAARHGLEGARLRELLVAATEVAEMSGTAAGRAPCGRGPRTAPSSASSTTRATSATRWPAGSGPGRASRAGGACGWSSSSADLVQIRSTAEHGTTIRLHMALH